MLRGFIGSSTEAVLAAQATQTVLSNGGEIQANTWTLAFSPTKNWLYELARKANEADFGVFLFSPDDKVSMRGSTQNVTRDNVIFEVGLFVGALGPERVFCLKPMGVNLHLPSDLDGIQTIGYAYEAFAEKESFERRKEAVEGACNIIRGELI